MLARDVPGCRAHIISVLPTIQSAQSGICNRLQKPLQSQGSISFPFLWPDIFANEREKSGRVGGNLNLSFLPKGFQTITILVGVGGVSMMFFQDQSLEMRHNLVFQL